MSCLFKALVKPRPPLLTCVSPGTNLAGWLIYRNVEIDKNASIGLPQEIKRGGRSGGRVTRNTPDKAKEEHKNQMEISTGESEVKRNRLLLAFKLSSPEDLEDGYYTLGLIDPDAPDQRMDDCSFNSIPS